MDISDYIFNVGDEVITVDGLRGEIREICKCDLCMSRGFFEPVWVDEIDGEDHWITNVDAENGFERLYKIGNYYFNSFDKETIKQGIASNQAVIDKLEAQLCVIDEIEATEKRKKVYTVDIARYRKYNVRATDKSEAEDVAMAMYRQEEGKYAQCDDIMITCVDSSSGGVTNE